MAYLDQIRYPRNTLNVERKYAIKCQTPYRNQQIQSRQSAHCTACLRGTRLCALVDPSSVKNVHKLISNI